jgi:hypothetical protein
MEAVRTYSRRSLLWILFFMAILCALIDVGIYFLIKSASTILLTLSQPEMTLPDYRNAISHGMVFLDWVKVYYIPVSAMFFLIFAVFMWLVVGRTVIKAVRTVGESRKKEKKKKEPMITRIDADMEKRIFLHLISVLQREGRLLDFFSENLDAYSDDQIGAAVRNIHENCKKTIGKYVKLKPVLEEEEGDAVEIEKGFDASRIKLTGNVSGEPPFKGVIRHKGWKATKVELPGLSTNLDYDILAPAEVEVE